MLVVIVFAHLSLMIPRETVCTPSFPLKDSSRASRTISTKLIPPPFVRNLHIMFQFGVITLLSGLVPWESLGGCPRKVQRTLNRKRRRLNIHFLLFACMHLYRMMVVIFNYLTFLQLYVHITTFSDDKCFTKSKKSMLHACVRDSVKQAAIFLIIKKN